jgi:hypothetical protein
MRIVEIPLSEYESALGSCLLIEASTERYFSKSPPAPLDFLSMRFVENDLPEEIVIGKLGKYLGTYLIT